MRALVCHAFAPPSELRVEDIPTPVPAAGEVLVRIEAAGLNFPDALMVQGKHQVRPALPFVPGLEMAGIVAATGPGASGFPPGTAVMARGFGAFAEYCALPAGNVLVRPAGLAADVAAASLVTYGTSLHALDTRGALAPGETLLVLGAGGGVGSSAVEIGKRLGARVIAAASSAAKLELCRQLGADETIDYARENLRDRLRELAPRGVDVVYDPVGGGYAEPALRALGWRGRYLVVGFATGDIPKLPLNLVLLNSRSVLGVYLGEWFDRHPGDARATLDRLAGWLAAGELRPAITARTTLDGVAGALEDFLARRTVGKIVMVP